MMVSTVKYPSFKSLGLRSTSTFAKAIVAAMFVGRCWCSGTSILYYVLPAFFTLYLVYGFIRPRISAHAHEIEEEDEDEENAATAYPADAGQSPARILIAGLTGFLSGLLLSIPVGPINLTIMNEGARRGF